MKIGIIGASGSTGSQFMEVLSDSGFEMLPIGRKTVNYQETVESCDVIILSVPIHGVIPTIERISQFDLKEKLVINFSSIMSVGWKELNELKCDTVCIHPMFGPNIRSLVDQNIVVAPEVSNQNLGLILKGFEKSGANVEFSSSEEHDKLMAIIQAMSQFSAISLASTLTKQEITLSKLSKFSSITFRMNLGTISRILTQDAELWRNIQFLNPYFEEVLTLFETEISRGKDYVLEKDLVGFDNNFKSIKSIWDAEESKDDTKLTTQLIIEPRRDEVGVLLEILEVFRDCEINLIKIKSTDSKNQYGSYLFKVVVETTETEKLENLKKELEKIQITLHIK